MSNQLYSGQGRDINVFAGQSLAVSSITGAYTATIIAGAGIGTALATDSTGGATYGPYSGGVTIRLKSGEGGLIDYEAAVSPVLNYAGPLNAGYNQSGDVASLVDGGGNQYVQGQAQRKAPYGLEIIKPPVSGLLTVAGAGVTINSSAPSVVNGETMWTVNATGISGTANYFEINIPVQPYAFSSNSLTMEFVVDSHAKIDTSGIVGYLGNAGYSIYALAATTATIVSGTTSPWALDGVLTARHIQDSQWSKTGFSDDTGNQLWVNSKVRIYVVNGQTMTFSLRSLRYGAFKKKARVAIISDDGQLKFDMLGVPILREFGFKSSIAVIPSIIGSAGATTMDLLRSYVAEGNECLAHGPNIGAGAGNLWTAYTTNAERIADINGVRDFLLSNGLTSSWGAKCYVWPQGRFCSAAGDYSLLALMVANGYTVGRAAITPSQSYVFKPNAVSAGNYSLFTTPIIGHDWVSGATEAANIAAINAKLAAAAASGGDCTLLFHAVVGPDAAAAQGEISSNRFREILTAIKTHVDAGNMEVVLYSEFAK